MAIPKKCTSRSKKKIRKTIWREKANQVGVKALSLARSILTSRQRVFVMRRFLNHPNPLYLLHLLMNRTNPSISINGGVN